MTHCPLRSGVVFIFLYSPQEIYPPGKADPEIFERVAAGGMPALRQASQGD